MIDVNSLPSVPLPEWRTLPKEPGIYLVLADNGDVMYVCKAQDLSARWKSHHRTPDLKNVEHRVAWLAAEKDNLEVLEKQCIADFAPPLNGASVQYRASRSLTEKATSIPFGFDRAVKWPEAQEAIRQRMLAQPRGYQAQLAEKLKKTPGFVNHLVTGRRPIPIEDIEVILETLNLSYDVTLSEGRK